jgi:hypothetical protein
MYETIIPPDATNSVDVTAGSICFSVSEAVVVDMRS